MRTFTQSKPTGNDAETDWLQRQQSRANEELQFYDSTTVKFERTTRGIRAHAASSGTKGSAWDWQTPNKELDPAIGVSKDTFCFISPGNILVTTGLIDIDSTVLTYSPPGIWQALIDVPAATGDGYHCPKEPPTTGSNLLDSPTLYWKLWQEHNPCVGS